MFQGRPSFFGVFPPFMSLVCCLPSFAFDMTKLNLGNCRMEPREKECHDKAITSIMEVPQETCDLNPMKICAFVTKLVPRLEPVHECALVPQEVCQLKFMPAKVMEKPLLTKVKFFQMF